jgi:hypothetical protein
MPVKGLLLGNWLIYSSLKIKIYTEKIKVKMVDIGLFQLHPKIQHTQLTVKRINTKIS